MASKLAMVTREEGKRWEDLAPELLERIFEKVGMEEKILSLHFVCKSWHKAVRSPQCWKSLDFEQQLTRNSKHKLVMEMEDRICRTYNIVRKSGSSTLTGLLKLLATLGGSAVEEIIFHEIDMIENIGALVYVIEKCPGVKRLTIPGLSFFRSVEIMHIQRIISKLKNLEHLGLHMYEFHFFPPVNVIVVNCPKLVYLTLYGEIRWVEQARDIVTFFPKIRGLCLIHSFMERRTCCAP